MSHSHQSEQDDANSASPVRHASESVNHDGHVCEHHHPEQVTSGHSHHHHHSHHHGPTTYGKAFVFGLVLNATYVLIEALVGWWTDSMSLLADAGHNLSDILSLLVAWVAVYLASLPATQRRTFGWRSATILAAQFNGLSLMAAVVGIVWHSIGRLGDEPSLPGMTIALVALFGVVINGGTAYLFHGHSHHDLNARAVYWHMLVDALVSVSVIVTGFLIWLTGLNWLDTVVSFAIALVIFWTTLGLLRDAFGASMLEVPREIDLEQVIALLQSYPGVEGVRDVHVWSIGTSLVAITAHLIKPGLENEDALLAKAKEDLREKFGIEHVTLQIEREALEPQCDAR